LIITIWCKFFPFLEKVLQIVIIIDLTSKTSRLGLAGTTRAVKIARISTPLLFVEIRKMTADRSTKVHTERRLK